MKKLISILVGIVILGSTIAYAAWPTVSSRSKDWGTEVLTDADLEAQLDLLHTYINDMMHASTGHEHAGTTNDGPKIPINSGLTISSQAAGDLIYATSSSVWARLAKGTALQVLRMNSGATAPEWATVNVAPQFRNNLNVKQASTTTITVDIGDLDINGSVVSKTSATTLTLSTAGDWAGGVSLRATNTTGYVGIDASGNLKMHTTAPSHSNYGVSSTDGIKRYATWSGTVYRIIGWFRMNATGSGELDAYGVSNILDTNCTNTVYRRYTAVGTSTTVIPDDDTIPQNTEGEEEMLVGFVPTYTASKVVVEFLVQASASAGLNVICGLFQDSTANALAVSANADDNSGTHVIVSMTYEMKAATTSYTEFKVRIGPNSAGTITINGIGGGRYFGGVSQSYIRVTEYPSQLT